LFELLINAQLRAIDNLREKQSHLRLGPSGHRTIQRYSYPRICMHPRFLHVDFRLICVDTQCTYSIKRLLCLEIVIWGVFTPTMKKMWIVGYSFVWILFNTSSFFFNNYVLRIFKYVIPSKIRNKKSVNILNIFNVLIPLTE